MCWSGEASAVLATVGLVGTAYAAYKKEPLVLCIALGYFSLMELLQAFTYTVINECELPSNQIATLLGYLHIAFQPFFINAVSMHFIDKKVAKKIAPSIYILCFISALIMIIQVYPFSWAGNCPVGLRTMCSDRLCSVDGNWHIAWEVPANGIGNWLDQYAYTGAYISYAIVGGLIPILYGSWRMTLYHLMMGPLLARLLTDNMNEWPAVWCLLSIGLLLIVVKTPVRQWLYVKSWPLWPKSWQNA
jgi:hypothetical protein